MSINNQRDIIVFSDDWGRYPSTLQHIGKHLAINNRIIWIGSLGLRRPQIRIKDLFRVIEKITKITKKDYIKKEVIEAHILVFPFHDSAIFRILNRHLLKRKLTKIIKENNFNRPIIITSSPVMEGIIGELGESSSHYMCLDDYTSFEGAFRTLNKYEQRLLKKVDSVFSVSDILKNTRIPRTGNSYYLSQGVDSEHFRLSPYVKKSKNEKPVIGFFGLISSWIDLNLIQKSAIKYPEYEFVMIGPVNEDISEAAKIPNIKFTGGIPYNELPQKVANFDVGIIPKKINKLTAAMNSLKMLEYLSLGLPVVSTNLPEIQKFNNYVYIGNNDEQFISLINTALENDSTETRLLRRKLSEEFSWKTIADDILFKINEIEKNKK